jgi:hypothetical protein
MDAGSSTAIQGPGAGNSSNSNSNWYITKRKFVRITANTQDLLGNANSHNTKNWIWMIWGKNRIFNALPIRWIHFALLYTVPNRQLHPKSELVHK